MSIDQAMLAICDTMGYEPTEYLERVARAKEKLFSEKCWRNCPCDKDNENRFCISKLCREDIERDGHCKCRAYRRKDFIDNK